MHHASVFSRRDSVGEEERADRWKMGQFLRGEAMENGGGWADGGGEETGEDRSHIEQRTNHCGRTDRHTRRSAVLTIICGGRAVGAGCK